jgi:hypothetical protein
MTNLVEQVAELVEQLISDLSDDYRDINKNYTKKFITAKIARVRDDATKQEQARIIAQIPYFYFSTETEIQVIRTEDLISIIRRDKEVTDDTQNSQNKNFKIDELLTNLKLLTELCEKNRFTTICALDEEVEG